jgi:molecular chaperone GrpE (heat shock protein)
MNDRVQKYLEDMLIVIDEIESFHENHPPKYEDFVGNLLLRRGIERISK